MRLVIESASPPPIVVDESGTARVGGTRVTLESLVVRYQQGHAAEDLARLFPAISLADIYATIAYYLAHRSDVDQYLLTRSAEADAVRAQIESQYTPDQRSALSRLRERRIASAEAGAR